MGQFFGSAVRGVLSETARMLSFRISGPCPGGAAMVQAVVIIGPLDCSHLSGKSRTEYGVKRAKDLVESFLTYLHDEFPT